MLMFGSEFHASIGSADILSLPLNWIETKKNNERDHFTVLSLLVLRIS